MDMEAAAKERERQEAWWPLDTMAACSLGDSSCFLLEWVPQLRYFGLGVVGVGAACDPRGGHTRGHELELFFPKCMDQSPASEAAAAVTSLPTPQDTSVMDEEFDELLQNFWDTSEEPVGFDTSCFLRENRDDITRFLADDDDDDLLALNSASPMEPTFAESTVAQPEAEHQQPPSSASSHCNAGPQASGASPVRAKNCSSKRSATPEGIETATSKRSRATAMAATAQSGAGTSVLYPFTVVKPSGLDGGATLADINARILTPPARPVRHPVGEFACAPRAAAGNRPAPSGKTVAGFTRLHTAGRGTVTIIRTTG